VNACRQEEGDIAKTSCLKPITKLFQLTEETIIDFVTANYMYIRIAFFPL
jgi:hypothetical protein